MRAAVVRRFGPPDIVTVEDRPSPKGGDKDLVVRVHTAAVTSADARIRAARFPRGFGLLGRLIFGVRRPRRPVLGANVAGIVETVGAKVTGFAPGDRVAVVTGLAMGAHAELVVVRASKVAVLPPTVSFDDGAGVLFGGLTAWSYLHDKLRVSAGSSVLVIGAAGAVGSNTVQLAALAGCHVTGVCRAANAETVIALGASTTIDYVATPIDTIDERYDIVIDTVGVLTIASGRRLLRPGGRLGLMVTTLGQTVRARGAVVAGPATERIEDIRRLLDLVSDGSLRVVIDSVVPLDDIATAHRTVDTGHKRGNVLVRIAGTS
jgi:NADPH:quinone reductase-like Zn-dependent oxidoreductase